MGKAERIGELRALTRLAADRAQAALARREAERKAIRAEIATLTKPWSGKVDTQNPIAACQASAKWNDWRRHRRGQLAEALAAITENCVQARTRAARLEAKVRAVGKMADREKAVEQRKQRRRALRQGLPEP